MLDPKLIYFKNGTPAWQGKCAETGMTVQTMLNKEERTTLKENSKLKGEDTNNAYPKT